MTYRTFDGTSQVEAITDGRFSSDGAIATNSVTADKIVYTVGAELTIASGVITVTNSYHTVDTESDASSDDLDTINGGEEGMQLVLRADNSGRTVVVKDATGNIFLDGGSDFSLDHKTDTIHLMYASNNWREIGRANIA
tara:strand:+ start:458 stop:874 length:417 start_codon:yes stop_codon:yes gene_type:complete